MSGQVGIAGRDRSQTQNQGIDADSLLSLLGDVRDAAIGIDKTSRASVLAYADTIQAEAESDEADPELTREVLRRLKQLAEKIGDTALNTAVGAL